MPRPSSFLTHHALAAYAEPLVVRRRVVLLGAGEASDEGVADRLLNLGAREVRTLAPSDDLGVFAAASFDLALVTDLGAFDAPAQLLTHLARLVGDGGAALVFASNRDVERAADAHEVRGVGAARGVRAFDYYELFDLVAREFADVKMVAQVPFHGIVLAELGVNDDSPAVSIDTQLAEGQRPPQAYVALASQRGVSLEAYAIFELPAPAPPLPVRESPGPDRAAVAELQADLLRERLRAEALSTQIDTLEFQLARAAQLEREVATLRPQVARAAEFEREVATLRPQVARAAEFEREVGALRPQVARAGEIEREVVLLRSHMARAAEIEREVLVLRPQVMRAVELEHEVIARGRALAQLSSEVESMRSAAEAGALAAAQIEELAHRADRAERALVRIQPELEGVAEAHAAELQRFEITLRERAAAVRALEGEVARRERMVHDLLAALEDAGAVALHAPGLAAPAPTDDDAQGAAAAALHENARLRARLDAMAIELARREADAQASGWKLAELDRRLAELSSRAAQSAPPEPSVSRRSPEMAAALDQIDALRLALAQEHDQRVRAEGALKRSPAATAEPEPPV